MLIKIEVLAGAGEMYAALRGGEADETLTVALANGRVETDLGDLALLLQTTSGALTPTLRAHLENHFARGAAPSGSCPFCRLQGRVLAAQGRRRLEDTEHHKRVIPAQQGEGCVAQRVREGLTRSALDRVDVARERRASATAKLQPRLNVGKGVTGKELAELF